MGDFINKIFDFVKSVFDVDGVSAILGVPAEYIYIGAAIVVIGALIALIKKASKIGVTLFVLGFLLVAVGPTVKGFLASNGVEFNNKVLTIETTSGKKETVDLTVVKSYETKEEGENTLITVYFKSAEPQTFTVPTSVAKWSVKIMKVAGKIVEAGGNAANKLGDEIPPDESTTQEPEPVPAG